MPRGLRQILSSKLFFALACLALVLILDAVLFWVIKGKNFFALEMSPAHTLQGPLIQILYLAPEIVILAVGMTLVASCSAGADISVGSVAVLAGAVGVRLLRGSDTTGNNVLVYAVPLAVAFLAYLVVGAICGAWNGFLVAKLKVQPMVATLILFIAARAVAKVVLGQTQMSINPITFSWAGNYITDSQGNNIIPIPTQVFIAAGVVIVAILVLRFTALGTDIQSVGVNAKASRILGLKSQKIIWVVFIFCGVCAAISGIIMTSRGALVDCQWGGRLVELDMILAVALGGNSLAGGKFSIGGSVVGALTIQSLKTGLLNIGIRSEQLPMYQAIVVVIIVIIQSPELRPMLDHAVGWVRGLATSRKVEVVAA